MTAAYTLTFLAILAVLIGWLVVDYRRHSKRVRRGMATGKPASDPRNWSKQYMDSIK